MRRPHHRLQRRVAPVRRPSGSSVPVSPALIDRTQRVFEAARIGKPVDLGPAAPGTIRLFTPVFGDSGLPIDWFYNTLLSHDRTFTEWLTLINGMKDCASNVDAVTGPPFNPFTHRHQAGALMEAIFLRNMRLRWIIRKFVCALRRKIMNRRHVGDIDLYTTLPIPERARVVVYDWASRSKYSFHTHTAIQIIEKGLQYSCYGIAHPNEPKNPYTNIAWNLGQRMVIVSQITHNLMNVHRFLPRLLYSYCAHRYDIKKFFQSNRAQLQIGAALSFFQNHHDPDVISISNEILDGLYNDSHNVHDSTWKKIKREILSRTLPADYQQRWDRLVIGSWIMDNHGVVYEMFRALNDIDTEFRDLYSASVSWWMIQPRTLLRRPAQSESSTMLE